MDHLAQSLQQQPGKERPVDIGFSYAAVALLIRPDGELLFIRRAAHPKDPWSGHMAFPGGRIDPEDASAEHAARREVFEEIGVVLSSARMLGVLNQVASPDLAPRVCVTPYVYLLPKDPELTLDVSEVASVHWYSIDTLRTHRSQFTYRYNGAVYNLPCIDQEDRRIWGMTLRIVDDVLERITTEIG